MKFFNEELDTNKISQSTQAIFAWQMKYLPNDGITDSDLIFLMEEKQRRLNGVLNVYDAIEIACTQKLGNWLISYARNNEDFQDLYLAHSVQFETPDATLIYALYDEHQDLLKETLYDELVNNEIVDDIHNHLAFAIQGTSTLHFVGGHIIKQADDVTHALCHLLNKQGITQALVEQLQENELAVNVWEQQNLLEKSNNSLTKTTLNLL